MTDIALKSHTALKSQAGIAAWLSAAIDWLRQARVAARLPHESVEDLPDSQAAMPAWDLRAVWDFRAMSVMALSGFSRYQIWFEGVSMLRSCRIEKQTGNE